MKDPSQHEVEGCGFCPFCHQGDFDRSECSHPDVEKRIDEGDKDFSSSTEIPKRCPLREGPVWVRLEK